MPFRTKLGCFHCILNLLWTSSLEHPHLFMRAIKMPIMFHKSCYFIKISLTLVKFCLHLFWSYCSCWNELNVYSSYLRSKNKVFFTLYTLTSEIPSEINKTHTKRPTNPIFKEFNNFNLRKYFKIMTFMTVFVCIVLWSHNNFSNVCYNFVYAFTFSSCVTW